MTFYIVVALFLLSLSADSTAYKCYGCSTRLNGTNCCYEATGLIECPNEQPERCLITKEYLRKGKGYWVLIEVKRECGNKDSLDGICRSTSPTGDTVKCGEICFGPECNNKTLSVY